MDLDQWISKVKDGQHLSEDELQLLCEYVRPSSCFICILVVDDFESGHCISLVIRFRAFPSVVSMVQ